MVIIITCIRPRPISQTGNLVSSISINNRKQNRFTVRIIDLEMCKSRWMQTKCKKNYCDAGNVIVGEALAQEVAKYFEEIVANCWKTLQPSLDHSPWRNCTVQRPSPRPDLSWGTNGFLLPFARSPLTLSKPTAKRRKGERKSNQSSTSLI